MNPLQTDVLRAAARLSLGIPLHNPAGELAFMFPHAHPIPRLFLWIEFWKPHTSFQSDVLERTLGFLERDGYLELKRTMIFFPAGVFRYRRLDGANWHIQVVEKDDTRDVGGGETITIPAFQRFVLAAPTNLAKEFLQMRSAKGMNWKDLNTLYGMGCEAEDHPHFALTDLGWEKANLSADDLLALTQFDPDLDDKEHRTTTPDGKAPPPGEKLEVEDGAGQDHETRPVVPKRPTDAAFAAWRLRDFKGYKTQQPIADVMSEQLGRKVHQGEVSRWLSDVDAYLKAGNIFPDLPGLTGEPQSIDPSVINLGERQDHLTRRQRQRRDPDAD